MDSHDDSADIAPDSPEVARILGRLGELDRVEERVLRILSLIHSNYRSLVKAQSQQGAPAAGRGRNP